MPKRRGETDQQWMERLRRFRERDHMHHARANACFVDSISSPARREKLKLAAFMDMFHPDYDEDKLRMLLLSAERR